MWEFKLCVSVSETYTIIDAMLSDTNEYSMTGTGSPKSVETNGKAWDNTVDWVTTVDMKANGNGCRVDIVPPSKVLRYQIGIGKAADGSVVVIYIGTGDNNEIRQDTNIPFSFNQWHTIKVIKQGTTVYCYFNDTLIHTDTQYAHEWINDYPTESVKMTSWTRYTLNVKNILVKPL